VVPLSKFFSDLRGLTNTPTECRIIDVLINDRTTTPLVKQTPDVFGVLPTDLKYYSFENPRHLFMVNLIGNAIDFYLSMHKKEDTVDRDIAGLPPLPKLYSRSLRSFLEFINSVEPLLLRTTEFHKKYI